MEDCIAWIKDLDRDGMIDSFEFVSLNIESEELFEDEAFIDFSVMLQAKEDSGPYLQGQEIRISERSRFIRNGSVYCMQVVRSIPMSF